MTTPLPAYTTEGVNAGVGLVDVGVKLPAFVGLERVASFDRRPDTDPSVAVVVGVRVAVVALGISRARTTSIATGSPRPARPDLGVAEVVGIRVAVVAHHGPCASGADAFLARFRTITDVPVCAGGSVVDARVCTHTQLTDVCGAGVVVVAVLDGMTTNIQVHRRHRPRNLDVTRPNDTFPTLHHHDVVGRRGDEIHLTRDSVRRVDGR
ncbi:MAG: hypothetical protein COU32_00110 [Candidatus Magasanikbacteria bacterium CG10_big_fil_rev_8_21_14_0_10_42_10]|uniref:Uncharacterized protein n=1 Tax=Candidatus Magasanikbacteria bacterium CG10_big_fil_rev_8_21_14_0_10_42_10 TaxID=1974649 RepID=A0A2H0TXC7_9BACT|nr:MAG: hypothetical protein COU32_00110 [Candidatus Magasanikbacteria bacterium CG10_big_fil_rev_8_21_14_0_10_42_10]